MRQIILAAFVLCSVATNADARFDCGRVQRAYFNLPPKFNLALNWATLPHTTPHPGAVVVQRRAGRALGGGPGGHVSRIESVLDHCRAIVTDEKGIRLAKRHESLSLRALRVQGALPGEIRKDWPS